ncbi:MAG: DUF1376 domain-containing protein [Pseudomonadota bacterium]
MTDSSIWMPLYIGDYLADTQLLSTEQHGAYLLLIMAYWKNQGPLPNDEAILMSVCKLQPAKWKVCKPAVMKFFQVRSSMLVHKRIDKEIKNTKELRDKASAKAKKAANTRWEKDASSNASGNAPSIPSSIAQSSSPSNARSNASHNHNHNTTPVPVESWPDADLDTGEIL